MQAIIDYISQPWPWYVSGPLIALTMFILLFAGKQFGMSSNLRTVCSIGGAGKFSDFFRYDWKAHRWNLVVVLGAIIGGYIGANYLTADVQISASAVEQLDQYEIAVNGYMPEALFGNEVFSNPYFLGLLTIGGFLVGFGARYAGGCTSGHAISGLSNLQLPSLIAVVGFFIGGLVMVHLFFPLIF